jgi:VanZ family protein
MLEQHRLHQIRPLIDTRLARWLAAIGWMALIFVLSAQSQLPSPNDPLLNFLLRKLAHFTVYAVLAFLFWRALPRSGGLCAWSWLLAVLYAISDEYHQSFVALRHPEARDVVIDACGAATALLIIWYAGRRAANDRRL